MPERKVVDWFTMNGKHIPLFEGESKQDAINRSIAHSNEDKKQSDIKKSEDDANKLNQEKKSLDTKVNSVDTKQFVSTLKNAKDSRTELDKWRVDVHDEDDYKSRDCKCYTSKGGSTVAVDKDGDIISVCKRKGDDTIKGSELLAEAVKLGGRKLDSFEGNHTFYTNNGFEPISWTPFNTEYAPDGWKESGCGAEDVIFYKYVGKGNVKYTDLEQFKKYGKKFTGDDGYDNAMKYRDSNMKKRG